MSQRPADQTLITINNNAYKKTGLGQPIPELEAFDAPTEWLEQFAQLIWKYLPDAQKAEARVAMNKDNVEKKLPPVTAENEYKFIKALLEKSMGKESNSARVRKGLIKLFAIMSGKVDHKGTLNFNHKNDANCVDVALKMYERILKCEEGVETGLNEIEKGFMEPRNFEQRLEKVRFGIVKRVAIANSETVHGQNYFTVVAEDLGRHGTSAINKDDPYTGEGESQDWTPQTVGQQLDRGFRIHYTPLLIIRDIEGQYHDVYTEEEYRLMVDGEVSNIAKYNGVVCETFNRELAGKTGEEEKIFNVEWFHYTTDENFIEFEIQGTNWHYIQEKIFIELCNQGFITCPANVTKPVEIKPNSDDELKYWVTLGGTMNQYMAWFPNPNQQLPEILRVIACTPLNCPFNKSIIEYLREKNITLLSLCDAVNNKPELLQNREFMNNFSRIIRHMPPEQFINCVESRPPRLPNILKGLSSDSCAEFIDYLKGKLVPIENMILFLRQYRDSEAFEYDIIHEPKKVLYLMQLMEDVNRQVEQLNRRRSNREQIKPITVPYENVNKKLNAAVKNTSANENTFRTKDKVTFAYTLQQYVRKALGASEQRKNNNKNELFNQVAYGGNLDIITKDLNEEEEKNFVKLFIQKPISPLYYVVNNNPKYAAKILGLIIKHASKEELGMILNLTTQNPDRGNILMTLLAKNTDESRAALALLLNNLKDKLTDVDIHTLFTNRNDDHLNTNNDGALSLAEHADYAEARRYSDDTSCLFMILKIIPTLHKETQIAILDRMIINRCKNSKAVIELLILKDNLRRTNIPVDGYQNIAIEDFALALEKFKNNPEILNAFIKHTFAERYPARIKKLFELYENRYDELFELLGKTTSPDEVKNVKRFLFCAAPNDSALEYIKANYDDAMLKEFATPTTANDAMLKAGLERGLAYPQMLIKLFDYLKDERKITPPYQLLDFVLNLYVQKNDALSPDKLKELYKLLMYIREQPNYIANPGYNKLIIKMFRTVDPQFIMDNTPERLFKNYCSIEDTEGNTILFHVIARNSKYSVAFFRILEGALVNAPTSSSQPNATISAITNPKPKVNAFMVAASYPTEENLELLKIFFGILANADDATKKKAFVPKEGFGGPNLIMSALKANSDAVIALVLGELDKCSTDVQTYVLSQISLEAEIFEDDPGLKILIVERMLINNIHHQIHALGDEERLVLFATITPQYQFTKRYFQNLLADPDPTVFVNMLHEFVELMHDPNYNIKELKPVMNNLISLLNAAQKDQITNLFNGTPRGRVAFLEIMANCDQETFTEFLKVIKTKYQTLDEIKAFMQPLPGARNTLATAIASQPQKVAAFNQFMLECERPKILPDMDEIQIMSTLRDAKKNHQQMDISPVAIDQMIHILSQEAKEAIKNEDLIPLHQQRFEMQCMHMQALPTIQEEVEENPYASAAKK